MSGDGLGPGAPSSHGTDRSVRVRPELLLDYVAALYRSVDVPATNARVIAEMQVETDRRGIYSHGTRLTAAYLAKLRDGRLNPRARVRTVRRSGVCLQLNGNGAVGVWAAHVAVRRAIAGADENGAAVVATSNCGHVGAASSSAIVGARAGMVTFVVAQTRRPSVAPHGAREPVLGNTPVAVAIPHGEQPPIVMDLACGAASWGEVEARRLAGHLLLDEWAYDREGQPTSQPAQAAVLRPFGGAKGSAMAVIAEVLSGALTGSAARQGEGRGLLTVTLSPEALGVAEELPYNLTQLASRVHSARPATDGRIKPRMPGDRGWRMHTDADLYGIPLNQHHLQLLTDAGIRYGVDPAALTNPSAT